MLNCKHGLLSLLILLSFVIMTGCSSYHELSENDSKSKKKKGVDEYKNSSELVATNTFASKTSIKRENLESISSSISGIINTSNLSTSKDREEVMFKVIEYLNTPYLWGGTSKRGIDCSGFVQAVMYQALGVTLPRTSYEMSNVGEDVDRANLKFGDLLFFETRGKGRVSHVAIYMEDGYFVHSGSKTGVAVASLDTEFYSTHLLKCKRVLK